MTVQTAEYGSGGTFNWPVPATLLNGFVQAIVYGSPGQWPGATNVAGNGFGARIRGNIPVEAGVDSLDIYVADGGSHGWGGVNGLHQGGAGGAGQGTGKAGGHGGASSAVLRHSDGATMIEAAGGGGQGGFESAAEAGQIAGNGGAAGLGTGVAGADGSNGGSIGIGGTPIGAGGAASTGTAGSGGVPPSSGTGFGQAGTPTGTGAGGAAGGTGDTTNCGGGGGGGGGVFGGGGGAGGLASGGGGGGGAGLGVVDPSVWGVSFAGYSYQFGSVNLVWTLADPPLAPTLLSPANGGYADLAAESVFTFRYQPNADSGSLNQWAFHNVTTSMYWNAATKAWSSTIVWNDVGYLTSTAANVYSYQFPAGAFTDGSDYQWSVATTESYYNLGTATPVFASAFTAHAAVAPAVTVTAPSYGSDVNTVTPSVSWTSVLSAGPQSAYHIKVYSSAQYSSAAFVPGVTVPFLDSSATSGAGTASVGPLPPDTYRVFVVVADAHGEVNQWGSAGSWSEFTVRLLNYSAPTFTAVAGNDPGNGAPVSVLTVTPADSPAAVTVEYSDDGGTTWLPVLTAQMRPYSGSPVVARDYTIPLTGLTRQYRATENGTVVISGVTYPAVSPWASASCALAAPPVSPAYTLTQWWLSDPTDGGGSGTAAGSLGLHRSRSASSSSGVPLDTSIEEDQPEQQGTFHGFGNVVPITVRGDMYVENLTGLALLFEGKAEWDTFVALRNRRKTMVIRSDMGSVYYGILGPSRPADLLRAADRLSNPWRALVIDFTPAPIPPAP